MAGQAAELIREGYQARQEERHPDALLAFSQAAELSRVPHKEPLLALALSEMAYTERTLKNMKASLRDYRAAAAIYRQLGQPLRVAHAIRHVADILRSEGELAEAEAAYQECVQLYREGEPNALDLGNALRGYALLREGQGDVNAARHLWLEARELYRVEGVRAGIDESEAKLLQLTSQ